jgi:hypothetical protein
MIFFDEVDFSLETDSLEIGREEGAELFSASERL